VRRLALACLLLVAGCDRVPIDSEGTSLLVTSPDLGVVLLEPDLRLRLVPDGVSGPLTVRVGATDIPFDSTAAAFLVERSLTRGLNAFPLTVTNGMGTVRMDTLYALYLPVRADPLVDADAGVARVDAAAAPLDDGRTLVTGGRGVSGQALATADRLQAEPSRIASTTLPLLRARAGHTATPVAGGRCCSAGPTVTQGRQPSSCNRSGWGRAARPGSWRSRTAPRGRPASAT
jgi:hypothetical protein